jgi:hypothetical protein
MRNHRWLLVSCAAFAVLAGVGTAWVASGASQPATENQIAASGVRGVLFARPFTLSQSYEHTWRAERPTVSSGWVCVLDVNPELVVPTQGYEPVLFVGNQTAERINHGDGSGRLVVIVPSPLDAKSGSPALDVFAGPIWFGTPRLPEQVDARAVADEFAAARRVGIRPIAPEKIATARQQGGALVQFADRTELERYAATLVQTWAPDETELAQGLLQPLVR